MTAFSPTKISIPKPLHLKKITSTASKETEKFEKTASGWNNPDLSALSKRNKLRNSGEIELEGRLSKNTRSALKANSSCNDSDMV